MKQIFFMTTLLAICVTLLANTSGLRADGSHHDLVAAAPQAGAEEAKSKSDNQNKGEEKKEKTPEEIMQTRFPQPTKVGHLIGLPVLDYDDSTIGYVQQVVRTPEGKIQLVVPYRKWFGWAHGGAFNWGLRPVAVPIEVVVILALQIDAIDMVRSDFDKAPTWVAGQAKSLPADETIKIAIARR